MENINLNHYNTKINTLTLGSIMRILFTGASSFTGFWFVKELSKAGHEVTAIFQGPLQSYTGIRRQRVDLLLSDCNAVFEISFGTQEFLELIDGENCWDLFCHHAADVTNYKSQEFDIVRAVDNNTKNLNSVLDALEKKNCKKLLLTGSVFEQNEGAGNELWRAFSPYGLSKGFTADIFRYYASQRGFKMGKFTIPNPFGPYEDPRFTSYLMQHWMMEKTPIVNTPSYVRDNIHVSLLAKAYRYFAENLSDICPRYERLNPSGYIESQGDFAKRFANEMSSRLNIPCLLDLKIQKEFSEPKMRMNTDITAALPIEWNEKAAWDELAAYYQSTLIAKEMAK